MNHDIADAIVQFFNAGLGWLLRRFRRFLDRLPKREFSELSLPDQIGRVVLMLSALLMVLVPLAWLIWH